MSARSHCYSCGSDELTDFYQVSQIPVHSTLLIREPDAAVAYPRGDLSLGFCKSCGFIQNTLFDPKLQEYSTQCEESQAFSPKFNEFAHGLARRWIERHDLHDKKVLEIGCGKGDFLALLCELGPNQGVGVDPSYVPDRTPEGLASRVQFIQDFYSEEYSHLQADFVCCRHTLEHIQPTREFVETIRRSLAGRRSTIVAFELPDVSRVLEEQAFWDIYYEHCSYFSLGSLARLFRSCGFEVLNLEKDFGDQYLIIECRLSNGSPSQRLAAEDDLEDLVRAVQRFSEEVPARLRAWKELLRSNAAAGRRTAVWGSSSKAVAFLTTLGVGDEVGLVTDINPYRQNMCIPGTGHKIVPPPELQSYRPDVVIAMNPIYLAEIRTDLQAMGLNPELMAL